MGTHPKPGEVYRCNRTDFIVHFVEDGQVYGVRKPADLTLDAAIDTDKARLIRGEIGELEHLVDAGEVVKI